MRTKRREKISDFFVDIFRSLRWRAGRGEHRKKTNCRFYHYSCWEMTGNSVLYPTTKYDTS